MPIIYALVARGTCVLAEFTTSSGNFTTITRRLLEKIPSDSQKMSYVYDRHVFHYVVERGLVFLCMSDEEFGTRVPFAFLEDVKARWFGSYADRGQAALAFGMDEEFSQVLSRQMVRRTAALPRARPRARPRVRAAPHGPDDAPRARVRTRGSARRTSTRRMRRRSWTPSRACVARSPRCAA